MGLCLTVAACAPYAHPVTDAPIINPRADCAWHVFFQITPTGPGLSQLGRRPILVEMGDPAETLYPVRAMRMEKVGEVELQCRVANGRAVSCEVASERPMGYRFAEAALKLADRLSFEETISGPSTVAVRYDGQISEYCAGKDCAQCPRYITVQ